MFQVIVPGANWFSGSHVLVTDIAGLMTLTVTVSLSVYVAPSWSMPLAVAVLVPLSVVVWVYCLDSPTARVSPVAMSPKTSSVTLTPDRATSPVFVTLYV